MSATRSRREEKRYKTYLKTKPPICDFCQISKGDDQYLEETRSFKVIRNIFPYSIWDGQRVTDHLMVVPKRHTDRLDEFTAAQSHEYLKILNAYEEQGYNIYARAPASVIKSVPHQHTHLIQTQGAPKKLIVLIRRPFYVRLPR